MVGRPKYESEGDRYNQHHVLLKLERAFGLPVEHPSEEFASYDGVFTFGGGRKCVVEVKVRRNERRRYPTYMLSKMKYDRLCEFVEQGVDALLAVQWTDQLGVIQIPAKHTVSTGGRYDRNDPMDIEQVVLIPTSKFKRVPE